MSLETVLSQAIQQGWESSYYNSEQISLRKSHEGSTARLNCVLQDQNGQRGYFVQTTIGEQDLKDGHTYEFFKIAYWVPSDMLVVHAEKQRKVIDELEQLTLSKDSADILEHCGFDITTIYSSFGDTKQKVSESYTKRHYGYDISIEVMMQDDDVVIEAFVTCGHDSNRQVNMFIYKETIQIDDIETINEDISTEVISAYKQIEQYFQSVLFQIPLQQQNPFGMNTHQYDA